MTGPSAPAGAIASPGPGAGVPDLGDQLRRLERRLERERVARKEAERLLESTSRELYEVNLRISLDQALMQATFNAIPDLIFAKDATGAYINCNRAHAEVLAGLRTWQAAQQAAAPAPTAAPSVQLTEAELATLLGRLRALLTDSDQDAIDLATRLVEQLGEGPPATTLREVVTLAVGFDFDGALAALDQVPDSPLTALT